MPAFWKSLLGSSSKGSVEGDGGSIGSRRRQLDAHGSGHSSHRSQSNHLDGSSSSTASASGSVSAASLASTSSSSIMNSAGAATSTRSSKPHKPINAHSSSSSSSSSSNLGPVPITSFTSVPKSAVATTTSPDEEDDEDAIPSTPYSSGHSPSHARHRFPVPTKQHSVDEPDEPETFDATTSASSSNIVAKNTGSVASDLSKAGSFSPATSNQPPIHVSAVPQQPSQQQRLTKPDIPTTQTILANPLPQSSSGLAAAISSVLPSSNSHTSSMTPNGKGAYANDTGPRTFDIDDMIFRLLEAGYNGKLTKAVCLKNTEITAICSAAREVFLSQPTLIELSPPVKIVGDVHGQYSDLIRLFEMCGFPPKANYLFLGDYVDRGKQSLETILLLLCYKVKYPENFFLLRGNHECANVTRGNRPCFNFCWHPRWLIIKFFLKCTASTMNASGDAISKFGKLLSTSSIVYPSPPLLQAKSSVFMVVCHPPFLAWTTLDVYRVLPMFLIMAS